MVHILNLQIDWAHPQREDLYAALRPLLTDRPRRSLCLTKLIVCNPPYTLQLKNPSDFDALTSADSAISWFFPSVNYQLPDAEPLTLGGLSLSTLQRAFERSEHGLRLVGYPSSVLQELLDPSVPSEPIDGAELNESFLDDDGVVEALPEWQNPDGEELLATSLSQQQGRPARDEVGLQVKPILIWWS